MSGPIKFTKDAQATFEFTVAQHKFANDAKTPGSLDELEAMVCLLSLKLILKLYWLYI